MEGCFSKCVIHINLFIDRLNVKESPVKITNAQRHVPFREINTLIARLD